MTISIYCTRQQSKSLNRKVGCTNVTGAGVQWNFQWKGSPANSLFNLIMRLSSSWGCRESSASTAVCSLLPPLVCDRHGCTTSHRWEKKALTGARKRLFSSWKVKRECVTNRTHDKLTMSTAVYFPRACERLWIAEESILSSHTQFMSVSRMWYEESLNKVLTRNWLPLMFTGTHGRWRRRSPGAASTSIMTEVTTLTEWQQNKTNPFNHKITMKCYLLK